MYPDPPGAGGVFWDECDHSQVVVVERMRQRRRTTLFLRCRICGAYGRTDKWNRGSYRDHPSPWHNTDLHWQTCLFEEEPWP